uniref:NADH-ubiquinone oxidoreductase chain 6 n=1 Tax=Scomberoides lysan TaxID=334379 RepID=A0A8K1L3K4_9TELE|nr:NADH dehydrogenase subunit 6 [Scomberoides lysan]UDF87777.1 NADH dehydrogenase subunit 6 [Scomberoides lysan]
MSFLMYLLIFVLVLGSVAVASNPSPYFAALGLVVVAGVGCWMLIGYGGLFLSLVLFLIYVGGMMVVFAYSTALAAEPYPESWGSRSVLVYMVMYLVGVVLVVVGAWGLWFEGSLIFGGELEEFTMFRGDLGGVALMYWSGGWMLLISAWMLLLGLFAVLELTRGLSRGALRAV